MSQRLYEITDFEGEIIEPLLERFFKELLFAAPESPLSGAANYTGANDGNGNATQTDQTSMHRHAHIHEMATSIRRRLVQPLMSQPAKMP